MKEQLISIKDFHYDLPLERIAKFPLTNRDESKLLVYNNSSIEESNYTKLANYLPSDSLMFFNNTKVIPARLFFKTSTDKVIEIFCLESANKTNDLYGDLLKTKSVTWKCIIGGLAKWKEQFVFLKSKDITISAQIIERFTDTFIVEFTWEPSELSFSEVLQLAGSIPIPPYLKRNSELSDSERYQTLYAKYEGSVAAPTAGLHFTDNVLQSLAQKKCNINFITLHVGAGTFKPVKADVMGGHEMHREFIDVSKESIQAIISSLNKTIVTVGTTSLRTIESLYWLGVKTVLNPKILPSDLLVNQWDPYELNAHKIGVDVALHSLLNFMVSNNLSTIYSQTSLLIVPGYEFKIANALVTNFHQPESTLILLVAAFIGDDWQKVYQYALNHDFRFLSYGDGSLLFKKQ
jgi:S-adenosylmethionine:tRNA ribosyltransferase-isomerase